MIIKPPIRLLTPPVLVKRPGSGVKKRPASPQKPVQVQPQKPVTPQKPIREQPPKQGQDAVVPSIPSFESLFRRMLERYVPETVAFEPVGEDVLRETIGNWLRPAYEQAIRDRRARTERINAELDADAWSRGMGESTYLTDVKERQLQGEAQDVDTLESNYAATLAGELYNALKAQQERKVEVDRFNAEQVNTARRHAADAAEALYKAYLSAAAKQGGASGRSAGADEADDETSDPYAAFDIHALAEDSLGKTDYRTVVNMLSRMTSEERKRLYDNGNASYGRMRAEILNSLGRNVFRELMTLFPA